MTGEVPKAREESGPDNGAGMALIAGVVVGIIVVIIGKILDLIITSEKQANTTPMKRRRQTGDWKDIQTERLTNTKVMGILSQGNRQKSKQTDGYIVCTTHVVAMNNFLFLFKVCR